MLDPNLELVEHAAQALSPLLSEIVVVGGCATALLITDPGAGALRKTFDIDVISEIASYPQYAVFSERLRALGFKEDSRERAPLCRWRQGELVIDVMPLDPSILGFSSRWYPAAFHSAMAVQLRNGLTLRTITAPYFLATKIEAFQGRGQSDYLASPDLEDLIAIVDGRKLLLDEVKASPHELRRFLAAAFREFLSASRFHDALPGFLETDAASQRRLPLILATLHALSQMAD